MRWKYRKAQMNRDFAEDRAWHIAHDDPEGAAWFYPVTTRWHKGTAKMDRTDARRRGPLPRPWKIAR